MIKNYRMKKKAHIHIISKQKKIVEKTFYRSKKDIYLMQKITTSIKMSLQIFISG